MSKQSDTIERFMASAIFASRRILAPFFRSLIIAMLVLLLKFGKELVSLLLDMVGLNDYDASSPSSRSSSRRSLQCCCSSSCPAATRTSSRS